MSTPPNRLAATVRAWAEFAQDDRDALRVLDQAGGPVRTQGFHAQQAVEKLLKAVLVSYDVDPEDTHVVGSLVAQLHRLDRRLAEALGPVDVLTQYAVMMRYPPRPGRYGRGLDAGRVAADVAVAKAACEVLDAAVRARLARLDQPSG